MTDRILIWGAGAIGGTVGAFLHQAGHDVTFVDTAADHVGAIRSRSLSTASALPTSSTPNATAISTGSVSRDKAWRNWMDSRITGGRNP